MALSPQCTHQFGVDAVDDLGETNRNLPGTGSRVGTMDWVVVFQIYIAITIQNELNIAIFTIQVIEKGEHLDATRLVDIDQTVHANGNIVIIVSADEANLVGNTVFATELEPGVAG